MAKRFTDTEKFNDPWYRRLSIVHKIIWEYLLAECNHAGILEKLDLDLMSFKIGEDISLDDLKSFGERIVFINEEVLFIPKFITFQYGSLNPQNKVHASVLKEFEKWKIQAPSKPLDSPLLGSKDKNKNKNKDKDNTLNKQIDTIDINNKENLKNYGEYLNVTLTSEQYGKLLAMCASQKLLDKILNDFSENIELGKEQPYKAELPNAHFLRLKQYYNYRKQNPDRFMTNNLTEEFWENLEREYEEEKRLRNENI